MKRLLRIVLRISVGLALLVTAVLVLCLDGVDFRPFLREPHDAGTAARLCAGLTTDTVARGELSAGLGRALLIPFLNDNWNKPR